MNDNFGYVYTHNSVFIPDQTTASVDLSVTTYKKTTTPVVMDALYFLFHDGSKQAKSKTDRHQNIML